MQENFINCTKKIERYKKIRKKERRIKMIKIKKTKRKKRRIRTTKRRKIRRAETSTIPRRENRKKVATTAHLRSLITGAEKARSGVIETRAEIVKERKIVVIETGRGREIVIEIATTAIMLCLAETGTEILGEGISRKDILKITIREKAGEVIIVKVINLMDTTEVELNGVHDLIILNTLMGLQVDMVLPIILNIHQAQVCMGARPKQAKCHTDLHHSMLTVQIGFRRKEWTDPTDLNKNGEKNVKTDLRHIKKISLKLIVLVAYIQLQH